MENEQDLNDAAGGRSRSTAGLGGVGDITERLRELDKKGYQPLTGAIGDEAATEIERLRTEAGRWQHQCEVNYGHVKTYAAAADHHRTRADNLQRERDEADRRAGAAERKLAAQATPNCEVSGLEQGREAPLATGRARP